MASSSKRLMLLRHAKSDWPVGVADRERPLSGRGGKAARRMGAYLVAEGLVPELVLVSTARRTLLTWCLVATGFDPVPMAREVDGLYAATASEILTLLRDLDSDAASVMVIAHNPGLEDLTLLLMASDGGETGRRLGEKFPTSGLAVLDFTLSRWRDLGPGQGTLERFVTPKSIAKPTSG
jgi:phosphohistidine phosphatase